MHDFIDVSSREYVQIAALKADSASDDHDDDPSGALGLSALLNTMASDCWTGTFHYKFL